jgi:hypothetical protein
MKAPTLPFTHRHMIRWLLPIALFASVQSWVVAADPAPDGSGSAVTINGIRNFNIDGSTQIRLDGQPIPFAQLAEIGAGYNALIDAQNANPGLTEGDAVQIDLRNLVRGPVTATSPLSVLDQPITVNGETVLVDIPGNDLANVVVGDLLEVSGYLDPNNSIVAARIGWRTDPTSDWKISGYVAGLVDNTFSIGSQVIDFTGATPLRCGAGMRNGDFVEVETLPNAGYAAGVVLSQVIELHCDDPNFGNPPPGGATLVSLEGIIQALPDPLPTPPTFTMLDLQIVTTAQTQYRRGTIDDLGPGVRVEVEGTFDSATQTVTAREVHFKQAQVRFEAPVEPADVIPGESVTIMGSTVVFSPQTRDEDGIAANGLSSPTQIEVRGLIDDDGNMFATRIRERGDPELDDVELRGPVASIDRPELVILGITVDASGAVYRDQNNQPISADEFYALVRIGTIVSAEDATYHPDTGVVVAEKLELEDDVALPPATPELGGVAAFSRGTITQLGGDRIFGNGFD